MLIHIITNEDTQGLPLSPLSFSFVRHLMRLGYRVETRGCQSALACPFGHDSEKPVEQPDILIVDCDNSIAEKVLSTYHDYRFTGTVIKVNRNAPFGTPAPDKPFYKSVIVFNSPAGNNPEQGLLLKTEELARSIINRDAITIAPGLTYRAGVGELTGPAGQVFLRCDQQKLFECLIARAGAASREILCAHTNAHPDELLRNVDSIAKHIRKQFETIGAERERIKSAYGDGYEFVTDRSATLPSSALEEGQYAIGAYAVYDQVQRVIINKTTGQKSRQITPSVRKLLDLARQNSTGFIAYEILCCALDIPDSRQVAWKAKRVNQLFRDVGLSKLMVADYGDGYRIDFKKVIPLEDVKPKFRSKAAKAARAQARAEALNFR